MARKSPAEKLQDLLSVSRVSGTSRPTFGLTLARSLLPRALTPVGFFREARRDQHLMHLGSGRNVVLLAGG
jgi:hypothetical protein